MVETDTATDAIYGYPKRRVYRLGRGLGLGRAFLNELQEQTTTALHWAPVAMALGIVLYFALPVEPAAFSGLVVMGLGAYGAWQARHGYSGLFFAFCAVFLAGAGFGAAQLRTHMVHAPMLVEETGVVDVAGVVADIDPLPNGYRLLLSRPVIERVPTGDTPAQVRVTVRTKGERPKAGDRVSLLAKLSPPSQPVAPGGFDFRRHAYFQQLGGIGFALGQVEVTRPGVDNSRWLETLRQQISARILNAFQDKETGAVAMALLTGEKRAIAEDDITAMRQSGLAHLLAISGLHIGLVAGFLFFSIRALLALHEWTALNLPVKKIAAAIAIPCALAACVVLVFAPESLLGASFQLSFAAVTALVAIYHATSGLWRRWHYNAGPVRRFWLYLFGVALTSLIASGATAPFVLYHFQRMALYGILANMAAVPMMAFVVMPAGLIALMLMPFGAESAALYIMSKGIGFILQAAHYVSAMDGAVLHMAAWPSFALLMVALGCVFMALWQGRFRWLGAVPVVAGLFSALNAPQPSLLISADSEQMALNMPSGPIAIYNKRGGRFEAENWAERAGKPQPAYFPQEGRLDGTSLKCGALGCRAEIKGKSIAFIRDARAIQGDCREIDILLSPVPVRGHCRAGLVIDRFDTWRNGGYAVYLNGDQMRVTHVRGHVGNRPWTKPDPAGWKDE